MNEIKIPQGYKLIANYNNEIVLAQSLNEENPEPYVTWIVHDSGVHTGCYFRELSQAQISFADRAFGMSEIIAEPILAYGATKEDVKSAQQKFRNSLEKYPLPIKAYVDTVSTAIKEVFSSDKVEETPTAEYESKRLKSLLERLDNCEEENVLMIVRAIIEYSEYLYS